jgi:poly-gamma-glutamate capsule biosynthesis protein CapA/YwtB (metallophosphatase superfamily)
LNNRSITLKAVGDIAPGDNALAGHGVLGLTKKYGCDFPFQNVRDYLSSRDILIGNLEGTLSQNALNKHLRLCGIPEMAKSLKKVGFDVLSLANNHVFDHGPKILNETISYCEEAGLKLCGLRDDSEYYSKPVIIKKNQISIGILAYDWVGSDQADNIGEYVAIVKDSVVNYTWNRDKTADREARSQIRKKNQDVISDITKLRKKVDVLILMPHWGYEWTIYPPFGVVSEARHFIDSGVDLIIGSHPHVIQGLEDINNHLVLYSLGNFLFDGVSKASAGGMLFKCKLNQNGLLNYDLSFVRRGRHSRPELLSERKAQRTVQLVSRSSKAISSPDAEKKLDDDLIYREYERQYYKGKYKKVIYLLMKLPTHPLIIKSIIMKLLTFINLILLRMKGKKVRW